MRNGFRVLVAAIVLQGGCFQFEQTATIFPDGSGKITLNIAVKKSMLKLMAEMAGQSGGQPSEMPATPFEQFESPEKLGELTEGIVAWKLRRREEAGEWVRATYVGYFEDVNQVRIYSNKMGPDGRKERTLESAWRYSKGKNGPALVMLSDTRKKLADFNSKGRKGSEELAKAMTDMMKSMVQDLKVTLSVTVPGQIRESTGFMKTDNRTATIGFDGSFLLAVHANPQGDEARKFKELADAKESRILWTDTPVPDAEFKAWKKEFADAREAWQRITGGPIAPQPSAPADPATDEEVTRQFIRARIQVAQTHLEAGRKKQAEAILKSVLRDYPDHADAKEAQRLLEKM